MNPYAAPVAQVEYMAGEKPLHWPVRLLRLVAILANLLLVLVPLFAFLVGTAWSIWETVVTLTFVILAGFTIAALTEGFRKGLLGWVAVAVNAVLVAIVLVDSTAAQRRDAEFYLGILVCAGIVVVNFTALLTLRMAQRARKRNV